MNENYLIEDFEKDLLDFEKEIGVDRFNMFEVLKLQYYEIRHSNFIAWILDSKENHQIGSLFIKNFLRDINDIDRINTDMELEEIDLLSFMVVREQDNIDIQVISKKHKIALIIENKIWHSECGNQLYKYVEITKSIYQGYDIKFIYLSPDSKKPSDEVNWITYGYNRIIYLLESILDGETIKSIEIKTFIQHYVDNLRRNIVIDTETQNKCIEIYKKHRKAIDLIISSMPKVEKILSTMFHDYILEKDNVIGDRFDNTIFRFSTRLIDSVIPKISNFSEKRLLLFEFTVGNNNIMINTVITPSDPSESDKRRALFNALLGSKSYKLTKNIAPSRFKPTFIHIHKYRLLKLSANDYLNEQELKEIITEKLDKYFAEYIPDFEIMLIGKIREFELFD